MEITPEKWERVKVLFEAALEKSREQRQQYLVENCPEEGLRAEVTRLLANVDRASDFLDEPAIGHFDISTGPARRPRLLPLTKAAAFAWRIAAEETSRAGADQIEPLSLLAGVCSLSKTSIRPESPWKSSEKRHQSARIESNGIESILALVGANPKRLRREARRQLGAAHAVRADVPAQRIGRSESSHRIFDAADCIARESGCSAVGVSHILRALIECSDPRVIDLLASVGVDRVALLRILKSGTGEELSKEDLDVTLTVDASERGFAAATATADRERKLNFLCESILQFGVERDLEASLNQIITKTIDLTGAQRGAVLISDRRSGQLLLKACLPAGQPAVSLTLASRAMREEQGLTWERRTDDASPSMMEQKSAAGMYAPLLWQGQCLGVICVETQHSKRVFRQADLRLLVAIAHYAAMAIANCQLRDDLSLNVTLLERLLTNFSPRIRSKLLEKAARGRLALGGEKSEVSILFSDIRGFTSLVASMPPDEVGEMLNQYFSEMAEAIFRYDGTIDKFIGDSILAVFGSPEADPDHYMKAVRAALEMQSAVVALNGQRSTRGQTTVTMGVGVHCGEVVHGFIGTPQRMEFTVVGDPVNKAARYCAGAKPGEVIISPDLHQHVWRGVEVRPCTIPTKHEGDFSAFRVERFKSFEAPKK